MATRNEPGTSRRQAITLLATGDISPDRDDPPSIFRFCGDTFRTADIVFGQMEAPLSDRGTPQFVPSAPARLRAKNISALTAQGAGFDVMSCAGNHAMDHGVEAFFDTLELLKGNGIAVVGAGKNIAAARQPVTLERAGTRVGFLAYTSILPLGIEAGEGVPGCSPLRASHYYQQLNYQPGTPPLIVTALLPEYRQAMEDDIKRLRSQVDVVVVSIHAGVFGVPAMIAMYQKEAAYAAIDAGADLILQHHAHILKGIEFYKGAAIFYGLGNFAMEHDQGYPGRPPARDPNFTLYRRMYPVHHRDSLKTMIAKAYIQHKRIQKVTYIPAYMTPDREPEVVERQNPRAQEVFEYVRQISEAEELNIRFSWEGDEVLLSV